MANNLNHLRDYVLVDLVTGTIIGDPRRVVLVRDDNMTDTDASDSEIIANAEAFGVSLPDFYYDED